VAPGDKALHDLCVPAGVDGDVGNALIAHSCVVRLG
jgi:hypothetical protein